MHKTILVPTDFCVASLNTLRLALEKNQQGLSLKVVLMYAELLEDSIAELLFYSPEKRINVLKSIEFDEALSILKNRFENRIVEVSLELFHGYNHQAFKHFTDANGIDEIYIPKTYQFNLLSRGFNPMPIIKKSKLPIYELEWQYQGVCLENNQLHLIFNN